MDWQPQGSQVFSSNDADNDQVCPNCGCAELLSDASIGLVCTSCSSIVDQNFIVNSSAFTKQADGSSKLNGQIIGEYSAAYNGIAASGSSLQIYSESSYRLRTIATNKNYLYELCSALKLNSQAEGLVEASIRLFTLLQQRGFLKGRLTKNVAAACLYTNCRLNKEPRILTDFAEVTRVNVFDLGAYYSSIKTLLRLQIPPMTAEILIGRYVSEMDFGRKEKEVCDVAKVIVKRLRKDYVNYGRKPEGICGAAIVLAARMLGFTRTLDEVIEIVKVAKSTVEQRLEEFQKTGSSSLKAKDFLTKDLPEEELPPVLREQKKQLLLGDGDERVEEKNEFYKDLQSEMKTLMEKAQKYNKKELKKLADKKSGDEEVEEWNIENDFDVEESKEEEQLALVRVTTEEVEEQFSDLDNDEEIENAILNEEQAKVKTALWMSVNKDYLEKQKLKKPELSNKRPRKALEIEEKDFETFQESAAHSVYKALKTEKKKSSDKLNYENCKDLFDVEVKNFGKKESV